jgi:transposase
VVSRPCSACGKLHADEAYDQVELRTWVSGRGIKVRIARKGIESSKKLGKHRWVIERSIAWLFGYHRLTTRYDRYANHFCAFLTLAATLTSAPEPSVVPSPGRQPAATVSTSRCSTSACAGRKPCHLL